MKRTIPSLVLAFILLIPAMAVAQQDNPLTAEELLIDMVGQAIVEETTQRSEEVRKAKDILDKVMKAGTAREREQAEKDLDDAQNRYARAQKNLDTARLDAFAEKCGKSPAEIQAMRNSGMGWGVIAKECGVHPSTAGKAKGKNKNKGKGKKK
jgi:hypothetical protein